MSERMKLVESMGQADEVVFRKGDQTRTLTGQEVEMILDAVRAVTLHPGAQTSERTAEHAGRMVALTSWKLFARWYGSDEKAWDVCRSVAASALNQVKP